MKDKEKIRGLRKGITVAALTAMSMQTGVDKVNAEMQFQQKEPEKKEIIVEKPGQANTNPTPVDTIAPFGFVPQEEVKPDTLSQTLPEEKVNPVIKPVVEEEVKPDTLSQTLPEEKINPVIKPKMEEEPVFEDFEYIDECLDFVDEYEEVEKAKKEGKLTPEEQNNAKDGLYTQAHSLSTVETGSDMMDALKPTYYFVEEASELMKKVQQYPQGSKEYNEVMKQFQQLEKQVNKETKKPIAEILGKQSEFIEDAKNNIRILTGSAGKDEYKIKDDFIKKSYKKSLDYLQEKAPEIIQERNSEKALAKKKQRRDKLEERAYNGNPFAKLILKIKERNEDRKDAKSSNLSDIQIYKQMKEGRNL